MAAPSADEDPVRAARRALTAQHDGPLGAAGQIHWWDRDRLRQLLIQAACPVVCVGHRQPEGTGPDWHEWCERKADAALAVLAEIRPPEREFNPDWTIHPRVTLSEALQERGITAEQFAADCGIGEEEMGRILAGEALYPAELAVKFAQRLGGSAQFWWRLRANYELDLALGRTDTDRPDAAD